MWSVNFDLLCSLGHVTWAGAGCSNESWAGREWRDNGDVKARGGAIVIKNEIHARVCNLTIHPAIEGKDRLFDERLGAVV